eukprot:766328-Hanusia_phi.AAC.6
MLTAFPAAKTAISSASREEFAIPAARNTLAASVLTRWRQPSHQVDPLTDPARPGAPSAQGHELRHAATRVHLELLVPPLKFVHSRLQPPHGICGSRSCGEKHTREPPCASASVWLSEMSPSMSSDTPVVSRMSDSDRSSSDCSPLAMICCNRTRSMRGQGEGRGREE